MDHTSRNGNAEIGWGRPDAARPRPNGWQVLRRLLLALLAAVAVLGAVLGLLIAGADLAETDDDWHGLFLAIGLGLAVPSLVVAVVAAHGLRAMGSGRVRAGRVHAVMLGVLLLALLAVVPAVQLALVPALVGGLLLLTVVADSRTPRP